MTRLRMFVIGMTALTAGACTFGEDPAVTFVAERAELQVTTDGATTSSIRADALVTELPDTLQIQLSAWEGGTSVNTQLDLVGDYDRLCPGAYLHLGRTADVGPAALALQNAEYDPGVAEDNMPDDLHANVQTQVSTPTPRRIDPDTLELALTRSLQGEGWLLVEFTATDASGDQVDGSFELARVEQDRSRRVEDTWD